MEHPGEPVVCERRLYAAGVGVTSRSILDLAQVPAEIPRFVPQAFLHQADLQLINVAFRTARNGYRRPDILNLRTREVFEIKPVRGAAEGFRYLAASIALFNTSAATARRLAPPTGIEWQFLRDLADIRPGLWVPPFFVLAGTRTYIAWLGAPGLILYRPLTGRRRPESAAAVSIMDLRELEQAGEDIAARTRLLARMTTYARNTVLLALAALGMLGGGGGAAGGAAAGEVATVEGTLTSAATRQAAARVAAAESAAGGAARALERAGRFARPRWDPGPGAGRSRAATGRQPFSRPWLVTPRPTPFPCLTRLHPVPDRFHAARTSTYPEWRCTSLPTCRPANPSRRCSKG
jgi:hypothetical protein